MAGSTWRVRVRVMPRAGILDPQGEAIRRSLTALGFDTVNDVRQGKEIELTLEGGSRREVEDRVEAMCRRLLANPVMEDYEYVVEQGVGA